MGSLGWESPKHYYLTEADKRKKQSELEIQYERKGLKPDFVIQKYPKEFEIVANKLMEICKSIGFGRCNIHPQLPGVQWTNNDVDAKGELREILHKLANHYAHNVETEDNMNYPTYDREYCMCNEWGTEKQAFEDLYHGVDIEKHSLLPGGVTRVVSDPLSSKVK